MIKGIIFDLDDTLCNTSEVLNEALHNTFDDHLIHFPSKTVEDMLKVNEEAFKETFLNPKIPASSSTMLIWLRSFELLGIIPPIKIVLSLIERIRTEVRKKLELIEGAEDVLKFLKEKNIMIAVLSSGAYMEQAQKVVTLGIDSYISYVVTPDICLVNKPDTKAFTYTLEKLQVRADEAFMVGDNFQGDIVGAKNAGIKSVYFQHPTKRNEDQSVDADYIIHSLKEIKSLL